MRNYTYQFEVSTLFTMFIAALDDIVVKRYNKDKVAQDRIQCRFVYAPKQRVLLDLLDKAQNLQLPVVAVSNGGITRDVNRVFNKIAGSHFSGSNNLFAPALPQPIPVDITVNMSILTRYQEDYDQIITNLFPYFDPYIEISWRIPGVNDYEIRSKVMWSGSIATQYPTDLQSSQTAHVQGDTSFTIQGWLFKSIPNDGDNKIFNITVDYSTLPGLTTQYSLNTLLSSYPNTTERFILSGHPQPLSVYPYTTLVSNTSSVVNLKGQSFFQVTNVYVSGSPLSASPTFYNPFSGYPTLSALYPGFSAVQVSTFNTNNDNNITLTLPRTNKAGYLDIIVQNEAGYGTLVQYASASYPTYNYPYNKGIIAINL
jgi:T4-like virus Myoviridae tail sheath stabiliser